MDSVNVLPGEVIGALELAAKGRSGSSADAGPLSPLATPRMTRAALDSFGLSTKKKLGQNFLVNDAILQKIVALAALTPDDYVLEVGPGIGTLTVALLRSAGRVLSVERDPDLPQVLAQTTRAWADRFTLVSKDGLDLGEDDFPCHEARETSKGVSAISGGSCGMPDGACETPGEAREASNGAHEASGGARGTSDGSCEISGCAREAPDGACEAPDGACEAPGCAHEHSSCTTERCRPNKFVANLPYAVAATLVLDYLQRFPWLESATVMVQKEVADRIAASPGSKNYGAYTVKLGLYAQVNSRFIVSPNNFFPPPHVDSAVVRLDRATPVDDEGAPLSPREVACTCMMADAAFASRRKTLGNSFKAYFASRGKDLATGLTLREEGRSISRLFEGASIDPSRRGETLTQAEFIRLGRVLAGLTVS